MSDTKQVTASGRPKPPAAGKGRPKGSVNKATKALKEMILQALDEANPEGGAAYLKEQAEKNPTAFMTLLGKVLPLQVNAEHELGARTRKALTWLPPTHS